MKYYLSTAESIHDTQMQINDAKELIKTNGLLNDVLSPFYNQRQVTKINNVVIIDVMGSLANNTAPIHTATGNTDYQDIINESEQAVNDGASLIVYKISSGGGTVDGVRECANAIKALAVPTIALVEGMCCSGAFWLASSCDEIVSMPSGITGSIGALCVVEDYSKLKNAMGITTFVITNEGATLKGAGYDGYTDEQLEEMKNRIDKIGYEFQSFVKENRPLINEDDVFKAGVYSPDEALEMGLIDHVISNISEIINLVD
jgi:ClpP class serine protease